MNLLRGAGVDGLGAMAPLKIISTHGLLLCRPLLSLDKKELLSFLSKNRLASRADRSNANSKFLRNWVRLRLVPLMQRRSPGFKDRLTRMSGIVRDEQAFWLWYLDGILKKIARRRGPGHLLDLRGLLSYPPAVQRRVLRSLVGGNVLTFDGVEGLRRWMTQPPSSGRVWQLRKGWIAERLSKSQGSPTAALFWIGQASQKKEKSTP